MKQLAKETNSPDCAAALLDLAPIVMRLLRAEIRAYDATLSMPQYRTLAFLNRNAGATLSAVSEHLGLALPSASKMVGGLISRRLARRQASLVDRRCVNLVVTARGESVLRNARARARVRLASFLSAIAPADQAKVAEAVAILKGALAPGEVGGT